jgi:type II secretory pathway pseudopilin PulG
MRVPRRSGHSAAELIVVLAVAGVVLSLAIPRIELALDRMSVQEARRAVVAVLHDARVLALASHSAVAVDLQPGSGIFRVRRDTEVVFTRAVGPLHGVTVSATRDSLAYDARGLGYGAANLSIVVRRRAAADTVFVSRLGRVR